MGLKTNTTTRRNDPVQAAMMILGSAVCFSLLSALVKIASRNMSSELIVFFRNLFGFLFILPVICYGVFSQKKSVNQKPGKLRFHFLRATAGLASMYCFFFSLKYLSLGEAVLFVFTNPLFIPIIAWFWLGEPVSRKLKIAILIGFAGVVLILRPGFGFFRPMALAGLLSGILAAVSTVTIRRMSETEPATRIVFYYSITATLISGIPAVGEWRHMNDFPLVLFIGIGLLATFGQLFVTRGYSLAPAARVGPFIYSTVIMSAFLGWILWGETLPVTTWIGAILIMVAAVAAIRSS